MRSTPLTATELLVWGAVVHVVIDWLLQNDWMARHKHSLRHPAGYVHAAIHGAGLLLGFPWAAAAGIALVHLLVDTRRPLLWWASVVRQDAESPMSEIVHVWRDQALHIGVIAAAALLVGL